MNILKSKVVILIISAVLFSSASFAQTKITGTVADNETKEPLVGAFIQLVGSKGGAITDGTGKFSLDLPANVKSFKVSFIGYTQQTFEIGNQTKFIDAIKECGEISLYDN